MSALDLHRRQSTSMSSHPRSIPPAPPLPPDHSANRPAPGFLDRFLYGPRRASQYLHQRDHQPAAVASTRDLKAQLLFTPNFGRAAELTPNPSHASSQSTSHRTGLKLRALDINESRTHVVLAGVKILKTVRVQAGSCAEDVNIRSAAVNYVWRDDRARSSEPHQDLASVQRQTFDIEDVAWSNQQFSSNIATAASNGKIMLYDLNRPGVEVGRLYEHHRQVHKVDFNPHEGQALLSGSQDGTVRLWDLRSPRAVIECKSKDTFPGRADGIRHTKWSPTSNWSFALGTDNGTIQRWDIRQNRAPVLKILAHTKTCTSIDWHPDGRHMISASKDQDVKVWDLQADRKQKPTFDVRCPKPVQNVRWRPPCYVSDGAEQWIKQCTHFATSYRHHPLVHVWDLRRPLMPHREFHHGVNTGTTDLMWHSQDLLWTVGPEGEFCQTDVRYMPRVIDRRPLQAFSEAPDGGLSFFSQERPKTLTSVPRDRQSESVADRPRRAQGSSPRLTIGSFGRGDAQNDDMFLSTSLPKLHSRSSSFKSGGSLGATPPSYEDIVKPVTQLNKTMGKIAAAPAVQTSKIGRVPLHETGSVFVEYMRPFTPFLTTTSWDFPKTADRLDSHLQTLESAYSRACDFEAAESVAFLRMEVERVLHVCRENPAYFSLRQQKPLPRPGSRGSETHRQQKKLSNKLLAHVREMAAYGHADEDDTSNAATPLARPLKAPPGASDDRPETPTIDLGVGRLFDSPEAARLPRIETSSFEEAVASTPGSDEPAPALLVSGMENRMALASDYQRKTREPLRFDQNPPDYDQGSASLSLDRRDSAESFQMFPTSWGTDPQPPLVDSAASSWTRNAAHHHGRLPSFLSNESGASEDLKSENDAAARDVVSEPGVASNSGSSTQLSSTSVENTAELTSAEVLGGAVAEVTGHVGADSALMKENVGFTEDFTRAGSIQQPASDRVGGAVTNAKHLVAMDGAHSDDEAIRSPSVVSHPESRTVLEDSIASLPPMPPLLSKAPEEVQQLLETIRELLQFHCTNNEVLTAAQMFLSVAPAIPYLAATALFSAGSAYRSHPSFYDALGTTLSIEPDQIPDILKACHGPLDAAQISPLQIESLLTALHSQLFAMGLVQEATLLRRVSYPAFPSVYDVGTKDVETGTVCTSCRSPINNSADPSRCETCGTQQADCPVCWSRSSPFAAPSATEEHSQDTNVSTLFPAYAALRPPAPRAHAATSLAAACTLCAHASHAACAAAWFADADSDGTCPVPGCGCDCVPGGRRDARLEAEAERSRRAGGGGGRSRSRTATAASSAVKKDEWHVGESSAVRKVSGALRGESTSAAAAAAVQAVSTAKGKGKAGAKDGRRA